MSVSSMAALASETPPPAPPSETDAQKGLRLVAAYIPSEALAAYVALLGILIPVAGTPANQQLQVKLVAFGAGIVLSVLLIVLGFNKGKLSGGEATRRQVWLVIFAVIAFFVYSVATPGGPWAGVMLGIDAAVWGGAAALVLGPLLPALATRLDLR